MSTERRPERKKLSQKRLWLGSAILAVAAVISACREKGEEAIPTTQPPIATPTAEQLETSTSFQTPKVAETPETEFQISSLPEKVADAIQNKHHIWEKEDLLYSQIPEEEGVAERTYTFQKKPPFYNGPEPLRIKTFQTIPSVPYDQGVIIESLVISDDPNKIANYYVYEHPFVVSGAQTYDKSGNLLAEAYIEPGLRNTEGTQFYLYEVHYDKNGNIQFRAKSELNSVGIKMKEIETEGKKENEYYFAIPLYAP
jgi:hypothetical protein